jgi:hypothetical protein
MQPHQGLPILRKVLFLRRGEWRGHHRQGGLAALKLKALKMEVSLD